MIFQLIKNGGNVFIWKKGDMFFPFLVLPGVIVDSKYALYANSTDNKAGVFPPDGRSIQITGPRSGKAVSEPASPAPAFTKPLC